LVGNQYFNYEPKQINFSEMFVKGYSWKIKNNTPYLLVSLDGICRTQIHMNIYDYKNDLVGTFFPTCRSQKHIKDRYARLVFRLNINKTHLINCSPLKLYFYATINGTTSPVSIKTKLSDEANIVIVDPSSPKEWHI
jgi:hypothetical protein